jgi:hypothetical protein
MRPFSRGPKSSATQLRGLDLLPSIWSWESDLSFISALQQCPAWQKDSHCYQRLSLVIWTNALLISKLHSFVHFMLRWWSNIYIWRPSLRTFSISLYYMNLAIPFKDYATWSKVRRFQKMDSERPHQAGNPSLLHSTIQRQRDWTNILYRRDINGFLILHLGTKFQTHLSLK